MSLILDALKRAERERNAEGGPAPGEVSVPAAGRSLPRPRWWLVAVALVVIGATAIGWKLWRNRAPHAEPPPVAEPAQAPVIMARPPPVETPAPAVVPGTETVASLDDLTDEPVLEPAPLTPAPGPAPAPAPAAAPAPAPSEAAASAQPAPAPTTTAPAEMPQALTQPAPLRKFREMPPDYRADFPALKVEIHVYEKAAQQRFVMVNGRRYREGERLAEGPQIVEIVPEGIVLEYRGEKVLYTLGR